jgi:hypothetical protein
VGTCSPGGDRLQAGESHILARCRGKAARAGPSGPLPPLGPPPPGRRLVVTHISGRGCGGLETRSDLRASTAIPAFRGRFLEMWVTTSGLRRGGRCVRPRRIALPSDRRPPRSVRHRRPPARCGQTGLGTKAATGNGRPAAGRRHPPPERQIGRLSPTHPGTSVCRRRYAECERPRCS